MLSWAATKLKRTWRGLGRKLRRWAYASSTAAIAGLSLLSWLGMSFDAGPVVVGVGSLFALVGLGLATLLGVTALPAGWLLRFWRRHSTLHSLEWDPSTKTVSLQGENLSLAVSSAEILSAHFIPSEGQDHGTLVLQQKGGREHHVSIASSSARAFLRASKLGPRNQATRITSTTAPLGCLGVIGYFLLVPAGILGFLGTSAFPLVLDLVGFSKATGYHFPIATMMAFVAFSVGDILTDLVRFVAGNTLVLGTDGIRWGKLRRKFIAYSDIASLRVVRPLGAFSNHQLIIEAKDGVTEHKIRLRGFVKDASKIVEERLRGALEQSADILMPQLDRQGRSDEEWREALRELVKHRGDYRKAAVPKERVRALLQDPAAPPEQRLGAAVALVEAEDPEARRILVSISENIADPELIDAIDSLAEEAEEFEVEEVAIEAETGHSVSA